MSTYISPYISVFDILCISRNGNNSFDLTPADQILVDLSPFLHAQSYVAVSEGRSKESSSKLWLSLLDQVKHRITRSMDQLKSEGMIANVGYVDLAFDGLPPLAKVSVMRKRRVNGSRNACLHRNILSPFSTAVKIDKMLFTPGTHFMELYVVDGLI